MLTKPSGSYFWLNDLAAHPERYPILPRKGTAGRGVGLVVDTVKSLPRACRLGSATVNI